MKHWAISLLLVVFLAGCSAQTQIERGMALRSALLRSGGSFDGEITADYGDKLQSFSMRCTFQDNGDLAFQVTKPDTISGITGAVTGEKGFLTFADTALQFDLLAEDRLSPVSAPWFFLKTLRSGYLTAAGEDGELLRLTIDDSYEDDALHLDIWLGEGDIPVRAEFIWDGRRILSMDVANFVIS